MTMTTTLQGAFERWLATPHGQYIASETVKRARRLRSRGFTRYGIGAIAESIRFDASLAVGTDEDGFKVNNNYRSRLARKVMDENPDLAGFFETRQLQAA